MLALALIGKICSIVFFFGAWWCYIPPKTGDPQPLVTIDQQVVVLNNVVTSSNGGPNGTATNANGAHPENRF